MRDDAPQYFCPDRPNRCRNRCAAPLFAMGLALSASMISAAAEIIAPAPMSTLRWVHTATLLPNGKVLLIGGNNGGVVLGTSELYDPATNTWSAAASLFPPRERHTATLLPNGKVLVLGGANGTGQFVFSADIYDPATDRWTAATSNLPSGRVFHSATLLPNGKVLVVGGMDPDEYTLSRADLYDPATGRWSLAASLITERQRHTATLLADGKVLVLGGDDRNRDILASGEVYDPATDTWSTAGELAIARQRYAATLLPNGKVLIAGGVDYFGFQYSGVVLASVELYDPVTSSSSIQASLTTPRQGLTATLLPNGLVLFAGGMDESRRPVGSTELYAVPTSTGEVIEFFNASLDHFFITWAAGEIAALDLGTTIRGWQRTGYTFRTYSTAQPASTPVCRYYLPPQYGDSHFFGRGAVECEATGRNNPGFILEDPAFMQTILPVAGNCPVGTAPVYRVFSNRSDANHRYMADRTVRDQMVAKGWLAEGDGPDLVVMCAPL